MESIGLCFECEALKFKPNGVALTRGMKFFKCSDCGEPAANYADGQTEICHECSVNMDKCIMCGRAI